MGALANANVWREDSGVIGVQTVARIPTLDHMF
jgi:hypothetical protein